MLALLSLSAAAEEMIMEVIALRHALVSDVVPVLEPLVSPGGTVTGMNDRLIIKSTPENISQLKDVLSSIDRAPRQLRILVRQDVADSLEARQDAISGSGRAGDVTVGVPDAGHGGDGASIGVGGDDYNVRYRALSTRGSADSYNSHFVTTLEGRPAWIQTGDSLPVPQQNVYVGPGGTTVQESIAYKDANRGFYVLPRINGQQVTLDIAPQLDRFDQRGEYTINRMQADTQVTGQLGEWIHLGGSNEEFQRADSVNLTSTRQRGGETRGIWVKVEEVR
jgi:type II secretory pathway component GspD/PulD (secretin)